MVDRNIEELARFVAKLRWEDIPAWIQVHAKLVLLDTIGVMLAGSAEPEVRKLTKGLCTENDHRATVYCRGDFGADPRTAALLNGIAVRSLELCEGHHYVSCQGGAQVIPGLLATAEIAQSSGKELLTSLVAGYEVAARMAAAMTSRPLAHQNGQAPLLGAVAGCARLRNFDEAAVLQALGLGATLMMAPGYSNAPAGGTGLNVAGGMSGHVGVLVPDLVIAGFTSHQLAVEQGLGALLGAGFKGEGLGTELGSRWEITRNHFRLRSCCNPVNAALDALEDALAELSPQPDEIAEIDVETYRFASAMNNKSPPNAFGARYSLPHAAAALVLRGDLGLESFSEAAVHDPLIAKLRQKVNVRENEAMSAQAPALKPARVTLRLNDGRSSSRYCEQTRRDVVPYTEAELMGKFRKLARCVLTEVGVESIEEALNSIEEWQDIVPLVALFKAHRLQDTF